MNASVLTIFLICAARVCAATNLDVATIDTAIRSGAVGGEFAERARQVKNLCVREITEEKVPYQLFSFYDSRGGYTLLVEDEKTLVILCGALGGGVARGFTLWKHDGHIVLFYRYYSGSCFTYEHHAKYMIGSGKPEETGPPKQMKQ